MKKYLSIAVVCLILVCLLLGACSSNSRKIVGAWREPKEGTTYILMKDGEGMGQFYGFSLNITYTYEEDILTIGFESSELTEKYFVTFFGDNEMYLQRYDDDGQLASKGQTFNRMSESELAALQGS